MADTASENGSSQGNNTFGRVLTRKVNRTKERFLHSLGKADRTHDEEFEDSVQLFTTQQNTAQKLQKEFKIYMNSLKAMQQASLNFYKAIGETYEEDWEGLEDIKNAVQQLWTLWEDYVNRLQTEVHDPLAIYMGQFPEVRGRISKRGRKLVDYDSLRHKLQSLENAKKRDEGKINKTKEELVEAEAIYHGLNDELRTELPQLYEGRINFLASNLASFFSVESKFADESSKVERGMNDVCENLQRAHHRGPSILASKTPVKLPISNGALIDSAAAVNLSQNQCSADSSPSTSRPNSNLYAVPVSQSGKEVPVPRPRPDSEEHHYTNEAEPQTLKDEEAEDNYEEEDEFAQYETVDIHKQQFNQKDLGLRLTDNDQSKSPKKEGEQSRANSSRQSPQKTVKDSAPEYASHHGSVNESRGYNEEEEPASPEVERHYRAPKSNEPIQDIPFGSNVLYKQPASAISELSQSGRDHPSADSTPSTSTAPADHWAPCTPTTRTPDCPSTPQNTPVDDSILSLTPCTKAQTELRKVSIGKPKRKVSQTTIDGVVPDVKVVVTPHTHTAKQTNTASRSSASGFSQERANSYGLQLETDGPPVPNRNLAGGDKPRVSEGYTNANKGQKLTDSPNIRSRSVTPSTRDAEQEVASILSHAHSLASQYAPKNSPSPATPSKERVYDSTTARSRPRALKQRAKENEAKRKSAPPSSELFAHAFLSDEVFLDGSQSEGCSSAPPMSAFSFDDLAGTFYKDPFAGEDPFKHDPFILESESSPQPNMLQSECSANKTNKELFSSPVNDPFEDGGSFSHPNIADISVISLDDPFSPNLSTQVPADQTFQEGFETNFDSVCEHEAEEIAKGLSVPAGFEDSRNTTPVGAVDNVPNISKHDHTSGKPLKTAVSVSGEPYDNNEQPGMISPSVSSKHASTSKPKGEGAQDVSAAVIELNKGGQMQITYGLSKSMLHLNVCGSPDSGSGGSAKPRATSGGLADQAWKAMSVEDFLADLDPYSSKSNINRYFQANTQWQTSSKAFGQDLDVSIEPSYEDKSPQLNLQTKANKSNGNKLHLNVSKLKVDDANSAKNARSSTDKRLASKGDINSSDETSDQESASGSSSVGVLDNALVKSIASVDGTRAKILYRVQATHMYTGEDLDELNFEPGDIICVIPLEDPDDQDDGWLLGLKEGTGERGVFPANFTKRL